MRIAVDAMGGDGGIEAAVPAALQAAAEGVEITLVGDRSAIEAHLGDVDLPGLQVVDAPQTIDADEQPVAAVRRKRKSSLVIGCELVARGEAVAFVSSGNTGALMVAAKLKAGMIPGIERPALGATLPTSDGRGCFMLDLGAVADCRPSHLVEYAVMGDVFVRLGRCIERPRVALLNVGTEHNKGTDVYRRSYALLAESGLNFVGNIEGRDILSGQADVVVCDGFVGNIVLKFAEGMASTIFGLLRKEISLAPSRKLGALLLKPAFTALRKAFDYREYGGAPLLGVAGIVVKCHGSSDARALANGIRLAGGLVERGLVKDVAESIARTSKGDQDS